MQVFISHSHKDQRVAEELTARLAAAGVKVWLAEKEVLPGDNWSLAVGKALQRSDAMVVLLSPDAVESPDVRREIAFAFASPRFEGRVVPVVVRPTGGIPWFLRTFPLIQLRGTRGQSLKRVAEKIVEALTGPASDERLAEPILAEPETADV
ncbi:MAG: toll/interleukin-1 receptor domain-containing protein [Verrucomicrobia bacterium]|nr:toll/interleukin-1 receptor domain-containing protein [Verrucomicrobiota bacterium]